MSAPAEHTALSERELLLALHAQVEALTVEVSRLREQVRRPERVRYRPKEAAARLQVSERTVYKLWDEGLLPYKRDRRGRFSTEAQVQAYERDHC